MTIFGPEIYSVDVSPSRNLIRKANTNTGSIPPRIDTYSCGTLLKNVIEIYMAFCNFQGRCKPDHADHLRCRHPWRVRAR